jgi:uncharacterized membrane protein
MQGPWYDEAFSITNSILPLDKLTSAVISDFTHPPLHYYTLHAWLALFGTGTLQARLLSVLFGTLSIPMIYLLAGRLYGRSAALLASALLGISQLGVMYSQEARSYAMVLFLALSTGYLFLLSLEESYRLARWGFVISAALLLYTNYYGIFLLLALLSYVLLFRRSLGLSFAVARRCVLQLVLVLLLFTPWLASGVIVKAVASPKTDRAEQPAWFAVKASTLLSTLNRFNNGAINGPINSAPRWIFLLGTLLFTVPAGLSILQARKAAMRPHTSFLLLLCLPILIIVGLSAVFSVRYDVRYVLFCVGFYYILVARGLLHAQSALFRVALIVAVLAYSAPALQALYSKPYKEDYRGALRDLSAQWRSGDCTIFWPYETIPLQWWFDSRGQRPPQNSIIKLQEASQENRCGRLWVVTYRRVMDPGIEAPAEALSKDFHRSERRNYFWVTVDLYARK